MVCYPAGLGVQTDLLLHDSPPPSCCSSYWSICSFCDQSCVQRQIIEEQGSCIHPAWIHWCWSHVSICSRSTGMCQIYSVTNDLCAFCWHFYHKHFLFLCSNFSLFYGTSCTSVSVCLQLTCCVSFSQLCYHPCCLWLARWVCPLFYLVPLLVIHPVQLSLVNKTWGLVFPTTELKKENWLNKLSLRVVWNAIITPSMMPLKTQLGSVFCRETFLV